jgi:hypothetical protein
MECIHSYKIKEEEDEQAQVEKLRKLASRKDHHEAPYIII